MAKKPESLPITVDDIDSAPAKLPVGKIDYEDSYRTLMGRFTPLSEENFKLLEENAVLKRTNATHEILNKLIEPLANRAFTFMCCYSGGVLGLLLLSGSHFKDFLLPDQVQSFLVGSTAVTVIGLVGMVLTGVFVGARKP